MPYGYDVANAKLPQAADPIGSLMQGGVQGITLGLGLQKARQDAQTNQLQQQAAIQEIEKKKFDELKNSIELTQSPSFQSFSKKDKSAIGKYLGEKMSNYFGQPIEIPEWEDKFNPYIKRISNVFMDESIPDNKKRQFTANILGEAISELTKDQYSQLKEFSEFGLKPQQSTGTYIYAGADPQGNLIGINNKTFETTTTPSPTGKPLLPKTITEGMANSSLYATRANDANQQLNSLIARGFDPTSLSAGIQKILPNYFQGENAQSLEQIGRNFGASVLRKESGAAITKDEWEQVKLQYIPQPGDKPETLKQKAINRERAIQGLGYMGGQLPELKSNSGAIKFDDSKEKRYQEWKQKQLMGK